MCRVSCRALGRPGDARIASRGQRIPIRDPNNRAEKGVYLQALDADLYPLSGRDRDGHPL